eukprot:1158085-Pelagomonas_calceolata.AAC.14
MSGFGNYSTGYIIHAAVAMLQRFLQGQLTRFYKVEHVKAERNVLAEVHSPYVVKLYYSFQDEEYLYLVMEYLPGGDVMVSCSQIWPVHIYGVPAGWRCY